MHNTEYNNSFLVYFIKYPVWKTMYMAFSRRIYEYRPSCWER